MAYLIKAGFSAVPHKLPEPALHPLQFPRSDACAVRGLSETRKRNSLERRGRASRQNAPEKIAGPESLRGT
jgi:hypothetical protein